MHTHVWACTHTHTHTHTHAHTHSYYSWCTLTVLASLMIMMYFMYCNYTGKVPTLSELILLRYTEDGKLNRVRIISEASHKWRDITNLICDDPNKPSALEQRFQSNPNECLHQTLLDNFINKQPLVYSQDWSGLIELLVDVDLETLAKKVEHALLCM